MTISVIIPTYNRSTTIERALQSVCRQTVKDLEVIVVDDGSTDNTQEVIRSRWSDVVQYHRQENQGACVARNTGASLAQGEYLAFLDSDDEWLPQKLEKQLAVFEAKDNPDLGVALCARKVIFPTYERTVTNQRSSKGEAFESLIALERFAGITTSAFFVHRRVFDAGVRFDPEQAAMQDWDFLVNASKTFSIKTVPDVLLINHKEDGGNHVHSEERIVKARLRVLEKYADELQVRPHALAKHHRGIAGAYRGVGDMANMRDHLRTAQRIDPSFTGRLWFLASYLGTDAFNASWRGAGIINRGLTRLGMRQIPGAF